MGLYISPAFNASGLRDQVGDAALCWADLGAEPLVSVGSLSMRGPARELHLCTAGLACTVEVEGHGLTTDDVVFLREYDKTPQPTPFRED